MDTVILSHTLNLHIKIKIMNRLVGLKYTKSDIIKVTVLLEYFGDISHVYTCFVTTTKYPDYALPSPDSHDKYNTDR